MTINTAQIEILDESQRDDSSIYKINRNNMPAPLLHRHISDESWQTFCNGVDVALEPLSKSVERQRRIGTINNICFGLFLIVNGVILVGSIQTKDQAKLVSVLTIPLLIALVVSSVLLNWWAKRKKARSVEEVEAKLLEVKATMKIPDVVSIQVKKAGGRKDHQELHQIHDHDQGQSQGHDQDIDEQGVGHDTVSSISNTGGVNGDTNGYYYIEVRTTTTGAGEDHV